MENYGNVLNEVRESFAQGRIPSKQAFESIKANKLSQGWI